MSDTLIVHAFDEAGRIVQEGVSAAMSLKDKAIAKLHEMPVGATEEHIKDELSAVFAAHRSAEAVPAPHDEAAPAPVTPPVEPPAPPSS